MIRLILFLSLIFAFATLSQSQELVNISKLNECQNALEISTLNQFGPTKAPAKFGKVSQQNPFDPVQYRTWYTFTIAKEGKLLFDIIPVAPADNYDFVLYKYTEGEDFCAAFHSSQITPITINIAPNDKSNHGFTGLSVSGNIESYGKAIDVKVGERYYLLLNNMYGGQGHSIVFKYYETYFIRGTVSDAKNDNALRAKVAWQNVRTKEYTAITNTDKKGYFEMMIPVSTEAHKFPKYRLYVVSNKYAIKEIEIATKDVSKIANQTIDFKMNKLQKGVNSEIVSNIYFEPNTMKIAEISSENCDKLYHLLAENPGMEIILEGHSNGFYPSTEVDQKLSEGRANFVRQYLIDKGIDAHRISIKGFGSNHLMYPKATDENEELFNRRVEINILKF